MVDGHFGASVYWDLMSNVFGRQGPDAKKYDVNIITHYNTGWDNDEYSSFSGNVHLGDGPTRQALDCLGHELGHALNDFTADVSGSEGDGLNESNSDIWGAMTTFYLAGGGFAAHSSQIPTSGGSWKSVCSGRDLVQPSRSNGGSDYYYPTLGKLNDVHQRGEPNNRAFHFLAEGASAVMADPSYSVLLPAGMAGIGTQAASQIWFDALVNWMPSNSDYGTTRTMCLVAASVRFGIASPQFQAVMNAYAGIGVGAPAPNYPTTKTVSEIEPNNIWQMATVLPGPEFTIFGGPQRFIAQGTAGVDDDWFRITLNAGQRMSVGAFSQIANFFPEVYQVDVFDSFLSHIASASSTTAVFKEINLTAGSGFGFPQQFYIRVIRPIGVGSGLYNLAVQYP